MKLNSTTKILSIAIAMLFSIGVSAQPANDNVCDAIDITSNVGFVDSNVGATVQQGEVAITPPSSNQGCVSGVWCDFSGADGSSGIDNSIWFKFDAPASGSVMLSGCVSDFDNQIAVYGVGDCSDFTTFTYVWGEDDSPGDETCGVDVSMDVGSPYSLSSSFTLECLTPGQTYYILVDSWQNADGDAGMTEGAIQIEATPVAASGDAMVISDSVTNPPVCMGGVDGAAGITITGPAPFTIEWSTGDTDYAVFDLAGGDYTVTVTNACGSSATETITIPDGPAPSQIMAMIPDSGIIHPNDCGDSSVENGAMGNDGQISLGISSGIAPYTMIWSTGDTTAYLNGLAPGDYTVTVYDACDNIPAVETFTLTAQSGNTEPAGEDIETSCGNTVEISSAGLGAVSQLNMDTDNGALSSNGACGFEIDGLFYYAQNSYYRAFDLDADFGLSGPVQIEGVDFAIYAISPPETGGLQPVSFKLHTASSTNLANATLTEVASLNTMVPDIPQYNFFRADLKATVDASEIVVAEISHSGSFDNTLYQFDVLAVDGTVSQPTYISSSSAGCEVISSPTLVTAVGFSQQTIMNLIYRDTSSDTYAWDDPNGDLSATDVANPSLTVTAPATYTVTVTDACGTSVVDEVMVDCAVGVVAPEDAVFTIAPNPSNGIFQLQNTDVAKNIMLQVFDLQGKMMQTEQFNGTTHTLDLSAFAAGVYVLKLDNGVDVETHKLIVY